MVDLIKRNPRTTGAAADAGATTAGSDVSAAGEQLLNAAKSGDASKVATMLSMHGDQSERNYKGAYGITPLLRTLLSTQGAQPFLNYQNVYGFTSLFLSAENPLFA
jgi:hypothetical protein